MSSKPKSGSGYSNLSTDPSAEALPVATAVPSAALYDDGGGAAAGTAGTAPSSHLASAKLDPAEIGIGFERGEAQPPAYRDRAFAVGFVSQLVAVGAAAAAYGATGLSNLGDDLAGGQGAADAGADGGYGGGTDTDGPATPALWAAVAAAAVISAVALSLLSFGVMARNAPLLIRASLWVGIGLTAFAAVVHLFVVPPMGIFYAVLASCLFCYKRAVEHKIPYAAQNLQVAIQAVRTNLGVTLVAAGAAGFLVVFSVIWLISLGGTMMLDSMTQPAQYDPQGSSWEYQQYDADGTELSPLGAAAASFFLLSFYWTHQSVQGIVRSTVAGVVGTFWHAPLEASSFCSPAVRDSLFRSSTYSLGSICFGSLIVAVLQLMRSSVQNARNNRNGGGILQCVCHCLLLYLERIAQYFNKWAFVYVGLYGYDYITAGKRVMSLFRARGWNTVIADNLVNRLLGIICLAIGLLTGVVSLLAALVCMQAQGLAIAFFLGFAIGLVLSGIVMGLVSSAVDSVIVCFCEAPAEFRENHPSLASEMETAWAAAWPDLDVGGPIIVSLGALPGIV